MRGKEAVAAQSLRVLHVMWSLDVGGSQRAVYQLIREQRRRGFVADVAVAASPGFYGEMVEQTGATVHRLECRGAWDGVRSRRLTSIARRYSLVHLHSVEPLLIGAVAQAGSRVVYTHRSGIRNYGAIKKLRHVATKPLVRRVAALSANTRQSGIALADWLDRPLEDVSIIYNGLDFDLLCPTRPPLEVLDEVADGARRSLVIGTAARLQAWKRINRLLDAVAHTKTICHCIVLGDGPSRAGLERQAVDLGIGRRVSFLGEKDAVGDYLQIFDLFILPSGPEEAFGNAAVEAMGVGVPTIVFADGGGLTEHVTDGVSGRVVADVAELSTVIDQLAGDEQERRRLGDEGRRFVRSKYSLHTMFIGYSQVYSRALGST